MMLALRRPMITEPSSPVRDDFAAWSCENDMAMEQETQEFLWGLVRVMKPWLVVEIGTHLGSTAEVIGNALEDNQRGQLITAEIDYGLYQQAAERVRHLPRVEVVCMDARHLLADLNDIELLVVDGDLDAREDDEAAFQRALAPGAIVIRHDMLKYRDEPWPGDVTIRTPRGIAVTQYRPTS